VRRREDGQLFFAPSTWKNPAGEILDERTFPRLGPRARARSRPNEAAPTQRERERDGGGGARAHDASDGGAPSDASAPVSNASDASVVPEREDRRPNMQQKRPSSPGQTDFHTGIEGEPD
jgi:hypothetical protein